MNEFFDKSIQEELLKKADKCITVHIPHEYLKKVCKEGKLKELTDAILTLINKKQEEN